MHIRVLILQQQTLCWLSPLPSLQSLLFGMLRIEPRVSKFPVNVPLVSYTVAPCPLLKVLTMVHQYPQLSQTMLNLIEDKYPLLHGLLSLLLN